MKAVLVPLVTAKSALVTHVTASENVASTVNGVLVIAGAELKRTILGSVPSKSTENSKAGVLVLVNKSIAAAPVILTVTRPLAEGLTKIV